MLNPHVFRAYDVRGLVGQDINPGVFRQVGRAYATLIRRDGGRRVAVGQDNRVSSAALKAAFVEGVRAAGVDVVDVGLVTTPDRKSGVEGRGVERGGRETVVDRVSKAGRCAN